MRVLDLFSGLNGWGKPFLEAGHDVVTLDNDPKFGADICVDLMKVSQLGKFDVILASIPCECFSVASIGTHWTGGRGAYVPKTDAAEQAIRLVKHTVALINIAAPRVGYVIENPRGVMRAIMPYWAGNDPVTVWYCQYGDTRAKPTDLWTNLPGPWRSCHNGASDHEAAPRGAKTGTQGISGSPERAKIPYGLAYEVMKKCEYRLDILKKTG